MKSKRSKILPKTRLVRAFFNRPTLQVARGLLGCYLVRKVGRKLARARITETEAYIGPKDKANHASYGRTPRTDVMFGKPGHYYVYLIYGMYYCLNVVTEKDGYPAAVLIRGVELEKPSAKVKTDGPGKLCRALQIDKSFNKADAIMNQQLWLESGNLSKNEKVVTGKRINVPYAGGWQNKPWRFYIKKTQ